MGRDEKVEVAERLAEAFLAGPESSVSPSGGAVPRGGADHRQEPFEGRALRRRSSGFLQTIAEFCLGYCRNADGLLFGKGGQPGAGRRRAPFQDVADGVGI